MSNQRLSILIVDDNQDNCDLLEDIFEQDYNVKSVYCGQDCLDMLEAQSYDLVLLDINMPEMDGFEVCRRIKLHATLQSTPVIFVSALASAEERLQGYECGAEDYITKPFRGDDIVATVAKVLELRQQTKVIEQQSKDAISTAFQAMTNSSELGCIIQFMQASYQCKTIERLADELLQTLSNFGLNSCLMFRTRYQTRYFGCKPDSMEAKVLQRFYNSDRIVDFGARTLMNDEHVSILVRNMPLDKPDDYGRIKDNLASLLSGTEARSRALEIEHELEHERVRGLHAILEQSEGRLNSISKLVSEQHEKASSVLLSINGKIESIIFALGLDEAQEHSILSAIDHGIEELGVLTQYSADIENSFKGFVGDLEKITYQSNQ